MFCIGEIKSLDGNLITLQRQFPFRVIKNKFTVHTRLTLKVGDFIRGVRNDDNLTEIEYIMVDTCDNCGAQFELLSAQYMDYPIPGCCRYLPTPLREKVEVKEIYKRHEDYALWLSNERDNFITNWISKDNFLGEVDQELEIGKVYNIVAWRENEHELVQNILMDLIELVDIEYK